jgi:hypothetical protein
MLCYAVMQVVLSQQGETSTAVHVYRRDFYAAPAPTSAGRANGSSGGESAGGEPVERMLLQDWVVASQVRPAASAAALLTHCCFRCDFVFWQNHTLELCSCHPTCTLLPTCCLRAGAGRCHLQ